LSVGHEKFEIKLFSKHFLDAFSLCHLTKLLGFGVFFGVKPKLSLFDKDIFSEKFLAKNGNFRAKK